MRTCAYSKLDAALAFTCVILRCALFALTPWALMSGCESDLVLGQVPEQEEAPVEMPSSLTSWDDFRPVQLMTVHVTYNSGGLKKNQLYKNI